jgi:RNA polymerase sigma factor (sigma-70 family)
MSAGAQRSFVGNLAIASASSPFIARMSDGGLVRAHSEGNPLAFAEIYRRYWRILVVYTNQIVGDLDVAEDIVQTVFIKLFECIPTLTEAEKLRPWLFTGIKNLAISDRRGFGSRNIQSLSLMQDDPSQEYLEDRKNGTQRVLDKKEAEETLHGALVKVAPKLREAFCLHHLDDLSHAEIAERLGVPVSTVKMRIHRTRQQLIAILARA